MLAGFTSQLRVRAGRHYRTDVWVETVDLRAAFDWLEPDKPSPTEPVAPESGARAARWFLVPQVWPAGAVVSGEF